MKKIKKRRPNLAIRRLLVGVIVAVGGMALLADLKPQSQARESSQTAETASYQSNDANDQSGNYSLVAATTNSDLPPCPTPAQKTTGILIEGDRPGENTGRKERIEAVVRQNNLQGKWCISAKTGNATWNIDQISVEQAVKDFDRFKEAGLVSLARPTDSASGRVTWQPAEAGGGNQNVSTQTPESPNVLDLNQTPEARSSDEPGAYRSLVADPGDNRNSRVSQTEGAQPCAPCPKKQARLRAQRMMERSPLPSGDARSAGI